MWLVRLALRNPYVVVVLTLAIVVLGVTLGARIPVDMLPQFKTPAVQIVTFYPGMPAETVERDISTRMQRWTGQSVGIEHQEAKSMLGVSIVKDFFHEEIDPNSAMAQVSAYAMSDLYYLPPGTVPPMVMPFDPTASIPLCLFSVKSDTFNETELYDIAYFQLRNRLQSIPGVIAPAVYGGKLRRILAYVEPTLLQARGLSPLDVVSSLHKYNVFIPTGTARFGDMEYQIESNSMVPDAEALNEFPIKLDGTAPVLLKDVGDAEDSAELQSNIVRVDGKRQLYVPIYRQPGANTIRIVDAVKGSIPDLETRLPKGVEMEVVFDQSNFVRDAIRALVEEGILGSPSSSSRSRSRSWRRSRDSTSPDNR
ncbi:MAG: efflux RND transporter permease subunit [Planctomycetes bacterium]|nr:efflux RND transporter permease subunit [Planctomycetota bacterium]